MMANINISLSYNEAEELYEELTYRDGLFRDGGMVSHLVNKLEFVLPPEEGEDEES